jgi:hypothetical protein
MEKVLPEFISNNASGEDLLENQPHESVAKLLFEIITNKEGKYSRLDNHVVGLEGEWGSGKTNVIKNLEAKLENFVVFNYDVWGHQEDLTRRTFLEELTDKLIEKKCFRGGQDWNKNRNELTARISIKYSTKIPKVKLYLLWLSLAVFSWAIFNVLADVLNGHLNLFYEIAIRFFTPTIFLAFAIFSIWKEIKKTKANSFWNKLEKVLYWIQGKDVESEEKENIIEDEPSVKRFKDFFYKILADFKGDGLIFVFDNMDRVSSTGKLMEVWSSIHTFFAEADGENKHMSNVWTIIPYDKKNMAELVKQECGGNMEADLLNEFLHKTFSLSLRIAPPVMTSWRAFFKQKFDDAFGKVGFANEEIEIIATLFKLSTDVTKIKPREIISFINGLVSLYLQHLDKAIDIKYLALYQLLKDRINNDNPVANMISGKYLESEKYLFPDEKELTQSIASIYYNIPKTNAQQLLLQNAIEKVLRNYSKDAVKEIVEYAGFKEQVDILLKEIKYKDFPPENVTAFLAEIENDLYYCKNSLWDVFAFNLLNSSENEGYFKTNEPWLLELLRRPSINTANRVAEEITEITYPLEQAKIYYTRRFAMLRIKEEERQELTIPQKRKGIKAPDFLDYCMFYEGDKKKLEKYFKIADIQCDPESELSDYFVKLLNDNASENLVKLYSLIDFLYNSQNYTFDSLKKTLANHFQTIEYNQENIIRKIIKLNRIFGKKDANLPLIESSHLQEIFDNSISKKDYFADVIGMMIAQCIDENRTDEDIFDSVTLNEVSLSKISNVLEDYTELGVLIKYVVSNNLTKPFWNSLIKLLVGDDDVDRIYDEDWIYSNISKIQSKIFEGNEIFNFLTDFEKFIAQNYIPPFDKLDIWWFSNMSHDLLNHHKSFSNALDAYYKWIEKADVSWWEQRLTNPKSLTIRCSNAIFDKGLEDTSKVISSELDQAIEKVLIAVTRGTLIPEGQRQFLKNHYPLMKKGILRRIADTCLDYLLALPDIDAKIISQLDDFIFSYSGEFIKKDKAECIKRKIIIPACQGNHEVFYKLAFDYTVKFTKILKYDDDFNLEIRNFLQKLRDELDDSEKVSKIDEILKEIAIKNQEEVTIKSS